MSWNYRVVKTPKGFSVYEVFYDDNGVPIGRTENSTLDFFCDSPEGLLKEMDVIGQAFKKPALDVDDIGREGKTHNKGIQPTTDASRNARGIYGRR